MPHVSERLQIFKKLTFCHTKQTTSYLSPCVGDLIFLIWFSYTFLYGNWLSVIRFITQGGTSVRSIMERVSKAGGSHSCVCTYGFSHPESQCIWYQVVLQRVCKWLGAFIVLTPITVNHIWCQFYFVFPSIWKACQTIKVILNYSCACCHFACFNEILRWLWLNSPSC